MNPFLLELRQLAMDQGPREVQIDLCDEGPPDSVLDKYFDYFEQALAVLEKSSGREHKDAAQVLCRLSRLIRWRLGHSLTVRRDLVNKAIGLFRKACAAMVIPEKDPDFPEFRNNIGTRATLLETKTARGKVPL